jgi:hypothetical protein
MGYRCKHTGVYVPDAKEAPHVADRFGPFTIRPFSGNYYVFDGQKNIAGPYGHRAYAIDYLNHNHRHDPRV